MRQECKYCGREYDAEQVKHSLGKESSPYILGYCSAQCYTKSPNKIGRRWAYKEKRKNIINRMASLLFSIKHCTHPNRRELIALIKTIKEEFIKRKTGGLHDDERTGLNTANKVYQDPKRRIIISGDVEHGCTVTTYIKK